MRTILILFLLTLPVSVIQAQDTGKHYRVLSFYSYGLQAFDDDNGACVKVMTEKFGFRNKVKGGCVVRKGQVRRWTRHNEKVEGKMEKRFGSDWHKKYKDELADCLKKNS